MKTIVLYPGSFSPFHIGHLNIVRKAEKIFGEGSVVVAIGINPDKVDYDRRDKYIDSKEIESIRLSRSIGNEVIVYDTFLHKLVEKYELMGNKVVVIRGLRNGTDLDYEVNQLRFVTDFKKDVNVIYITCDQEFEHISSSAINKIKDFGGYDSIKNYIVE